MSTSIESGTAIAVDVPAGSRLTISSPGGDQGGDLSFDGFDQSLTRNVNGWEAFGSPKLVYHVTEGMRLVDGDGETWMTVGPMRGEGVIDAMLPGCWRELYPDRRPGCRDLISAALGIERRNLQGMLSFFTRCRAEPDAYDGLLGLDVAPGDFVSFDAVRDVRVAVSACPDIDLDGWRPGPLSLTVEKLALTAES